MGSGIKRLLAITWSYATPTDRAFGILLVFIASVAIIFFVKQDPWLMNYRGGWCIASTILYFIAIVPPVKRMTERQDELVFYVAVWGIVSLAISIVAFYATYFTIVQDATQWEKILNLPPVFAAVSGTAIGWYVHQQLSAKFHRTGNSFNLVMQTRTSSEFIKHTRNLFAIHTPHSAFPPGVAAYYKAEKRIEIYQLARDLEADPQTDPTKKLNYLNELAKMEAIEGLKYLLNFYEFMAFGIHAGDLDETLLYETVSPSVVGWYNRSQDYLNMVVSSPSNKLAYQHLKNLVKGYKTQVGSKVIENDGWERRLEIEKANAKE